MAAIFAYDRTAVFSGMFLDCVTYVAQMRPGPHFPDAGPHRAFRDLHQPLGRRRGVADDIGLARIRNKAVLLQRDIEIDDVAVSYDLILRRHPMTDDIVDRAVKDVSKAVLPLAGRAGRQILGNEAFDEVVDLHRGHAAKVDRVQNLEHRTEQSARYAHQGDFVCGFDHVRQLRPHLLRRRGRAPFRASRSR